MYDINLLPFIYAGIVKCIVSVISVCFKIFVCDLYTLKQRHHCFEFCGIPKHYGWPDLPQFFTTSHYDFHEIRLTHKEDLSVDFIINLDILITILNFKINLTVTFYSKGMLLLAPTRVLGHVALNQSSLFPNKM